jgi:hypothetical protein
MLRRLFLIVGSAAMVALSALPASAAPMHVTTHKLHFPGLHGVKAWGNYAKVKKGLKVHVCAEDTVRGVYASGAVVVVKNPTKKFQVNLGAVAFGYHHSICRNMTLRYSSHVQIYTFTANNKGRINHRSKTKHLF